MGAQSLHCDLLSFDFRRRGLCGLSEAGRPGGGRCGRAGDRALIIEWDSLEQALAVYEADGYKAALEALGGAAERDIRILEGVE